jgi:hypothetical protein
MSYNDDRYYDHTQLLGALLDANLPAPEAWSELRLRYENFLALQYPVLEKLISAVVNGDNDDVGGLRALAMAEQFAQSGGQPAEALRVAVTTKLREIYADVAADNYQAIAKKYNDAAQRFTDAANLVDVEADASSMLTAPDKSRKAYLDAESYSNAISRLVPALAASATLLTGIDFALSNEMILLPLCINTTNQHRRRAWEGWNTKGTRTNRWGALHRNGIQIVANPDPASITDYALPRPFIQHREPTRERGVYEISIVDPEDNPDAVTPISPRKDDRPHGDSRAVIA